MTHTSKSRPIPAVGLAEALVLCIDFAIKVLTKQNAIFQPGDPELTPVVENAQVLQKIVDNLFRLIDAIENSELKKLSSGSTSKLSEPAQQLLKISDETKELIGPLIDALLLTQGKGSYSDPRWGTAREALCHGIWKERDVTGLKKKLRSVRKEVEVALLLALRQYLDQSAETGLPVFTEDQRLMPHWERWQNDALDAVHANEWKSKNKKHVEEFSKQVDLLITAANEAYFCEQIFERLRFEELDYRLNSIAKPHEGTLEWVFDDRQTDEGGLLEWFGNQRGDNLFWITGKPGAGKTTLMRNLFRRDDRIYDYLEAWSGHAPGITSGFFFWNCGTELQKSGLGLLRTLLYESTQDLIYGPLEQEMTIIQNFFSDRWQQFQSYGGGLDILSFAELRHAFELMISDTSTKFLFMIDGIDEAGEAADVVDTVPIILDASKRENVKVLVSSRPSAAFQEAFEKRPRIWVDDHTTDDVHALISHSFATDDSLAKLRGNTIVPEETDIVAMLSETSCGNFLWGILATRFLLQELTGNDNFTTLQNRAEVLPSDLDELLTHIMSNFEPTDLEQAWKLSVLLETQGCPSLVPLSLALSSDQKSSIAARRQPLKTAEITQRMESMRQVLTYKCRNLFSIFDTSDPEQRTPSLEDPEALRVSYTHRTIRAFFLASPAQKGKLLTADFNPTAAWASAHLMTLKTLSPPTSSGVFPLWTPLSRCIESSLLLSAQDTKAHISYLHAALETTLAHHAQTPSSSSSNSSLTSSKRPTSSYPAAPITISTDLPQFPGIPLSAPLDLAVLLNLQAYVAVKIPELDRKVVRHAMEFSAAMRRRVGSGGEGVWVGRKERGEGRGLEKLRAEYGRGRGEVDALLEYYVQAVRWGKKAPVLETGEVV